MRFTLLAFFTLASLGAIAQKVEFRNDSLFINGFYLTGKTDKSTIDSILQSKGKIKEQWGHDMTKKIFMTRYIYNKLGLIVRKEASDPTKLSIAIKLNRNENPVVDISNMDTKRFTGDLFIGDNYMNDKKTIEQLKMLTNCKVTFKGFASNVPGFPYAGVHSADIVYQKAPISLIIDFITKEVTCVFIN
jgi:hypothetical protein